MTAPRTLTERIISNHPAEEGAEYAELGVIDLSASERRILLAGGPIARVLP